MTIKLKLKNYNVSSLNDDFETELAGIDTQMQVDHLIKEICSKHNLSKEEIELLYRGEILKNDKKINYYLKDAQQAVFYLSEERQPMIQDSLEKPSEVLIQELSNKLLKLSKSKKKRRAFEQYLRRVDNLNDIYKIIHGIEQDAFSYSFIQSYDLILQLGDTKIALSLISEHPLVFHAVSELLNRFLSDKKSLQLDPEFTSKTSYSINDMSEDEDDEENDNMRQRAGGTTSSSALTRDFFSSVLASISQNQQRQQPSSHTQPQTSQQTQATGFNRDYFQSVMSQLVDQPMTPSDAQALSTQSELSDEILAQRLEQLHEFGFWDDERNVRALQVANGSVEVAISLLVDDANF